MQKITRTSPFVLRKDSKLKQRFIFLITENFKFVPSFSDPSITSRTIRLYHRKKSVSKALVTFVDDMKLRLQRDGVHFTECISRDMKKTSGSLNGPQETQDAQVVKLLNQKVREPRRLLFFPTAMFGSTVNNGNAYSQSQSLMMIDIPTQSDVGNRMPLRLWRAPVQNSELELNLDYLNPPSRETLLANGWKEVKVEFCRERLVTREHVSACRRQYTITHVAASTVSDEIQKLFYS